VPLIMSEPGWPLIPREVLPAPIEPVAPPRRRMVARTVPGGKQLSVFGVEAADPTLGDLAGLLAGPGELGTMGGTARVSVRVDAAWRVHVLIRELVGRGLVVNWHPVSERTADEPVSELTSVPFDAEEPPVPAEDVPAPADDDVPAAADGDALEGKEAAGAVDRDQGRTEDEMRLTGAEQTEGGEAAEEEPGVPETVFEVRTAYSSRLNGLARAWPPPVGKLYLDGPRLRLWVAAAGAPRRTGYALGLNSDGVLDSAVAAALDGAGLAGTIQAGPAYVIAGRKRLARLAELVGERPQEAPARLWPGGAAA
jgi:hypothetical protein